MMFNRLSAVEYENRELAEKIHRVQKLTDSGDEGIQNEATLMKLLQSILRISKQEEEWFLYFYALGEILRMASACYNNPVVVKYAELYYRDSDLYMNREIFYHAGKDESWVNAWICANICNSYMEYHQIDDAGMSAFMKKYEAVTLLYGDAWRYGPLEKVLQLVQEDVEDSLKYTTTDCMKMSLEWWCYFRLLDRSGVHEVTIELTEVSQDEKGKVSCLALSDFFEQRADDYGIKFEQARKKFDYRKRKEVFWECAGL